MVLEIVKRQLEVGRQQECEVGAGLRTMHWQGSFGKHKESGAKGHPVLARNPASSRKRAEVCFRGAEAAG